MLSFPDFLEALGPAPSVFLNEREPRADEFGAVRAYPQYRDEVKKSLSARLCRPHDPTWVLWVVSNLMPWVGKVVLYCWYLGLDPEAAAEYVIYLAVPAGIPFASYFPAADPEIYPAASDRTHGVKTTPLPEPLSE